MSSQRIKKITNSRNSDHRPRSLCDLHNPGGWSLFISPDPPKNAAPLFTHFRRIGPPGVSRAEDSQKGKGTGVPKTKKSCRKRLKSAGLSASFSVIDVQDTVFLPIAFRDIFYGKTSVFFRCFSSFFYTTTPISVKCEGGQKTEDGEKVRRSPRN